MAQVLINTHLDYNKQFQELRLEEQGIQKELRRLDNAFGHRVRDKHLYSLEYSTVKQMNFSR